MKASCQLGLLLQDTGCTVVLDAAVFSCACLKGAFFICLVNLFYNLI